MTRLTRRRVNRMGPGNSDRVLSGRMVDGLEAPIFGFPAIAS